MTTKLSKSAVYRPFCQLSSNSMKRPSLTEVSEKKLKLNPFLALMCFNLQNIIFFTSHTSVCEACFCKRTGNAATWVFQMQVIQKWLGLKYANNHEQRVKQFAHLIKRMPKQRLNLPHFRDF